MVISWHPRHARHRVWINLSTPAGRIFRVVPVIFAVVVFGTTPVVAQEPPADVLAMPVNIERACVFDSISGEKTQVAAGTYFVEIKLDNSLRLHSDGSGDAISLQAEIGEHAANLLFAKVEFGMDDTSQQCVLAVLLPRNLSVAAEGKAAKVTTRSRQVRLLKDQDLGAQGGRLYQQAPLQASPGRAYQVAEPRPDPRIADIEVVGLSFLDPSLSVVIRNNGGKDADFVEVRCMLKGVLAEFLAEVAVPGGETRTINLYPNPPQTTILVGEYASACLATIVAPSGLQDSNPSNNVLVRTVQISEHPYDIQLDRVELRGCDDQPLTSERDICGILTYNLENSADHLQTPWRATCWLKPVRQAVEGQSAPPPQQSGRQSTQGVQSQQTVVLQPQQTYELREMLPPGTRTVTGAGTSPMIGRRQYWTEIRFGRVDSGEFELECAIDTEKALPDTDRSNNSRSASFEVPGAPVFDLAVVDITGMIRQDGPVIYAHVENRGNQEVLFAKIECFRAGSELAVFVRAQPGETDVGWGPNQYPTPPVALGSRSTRCAVAEIRNPNGAVDSNPSNDELTKLVVIE